MRIPEERAFLRVPRCSDVRLKSTLAKGVPVVLGKSASESLLPFAQRWLDDSGGLSVSAFASSCGNWRVPVAKRGYKNDQLSGRREHLSEFLANYWLCNDPGIYMAQWQFPLDAMRVRKAAKKKASSRMNGGSLRRSSRTRKPVMENGFFLSSTGGGCSDDILSNRDSHPLLNESWFMSKPPAALGFNFLDLACEDEDAMYAYQYLFMGAAGTYSKLHRDTGGMSILIAPIVGKKEVFLLHRDFCNDASQAEHRSCAWRTVLEPGSVLVMPPGTYHAVKNLTSSLSYSRCHVTADDLPLVAASLLDNDAPEMRPRLTLWNGAHGLMEDISKQLESSGRRGNDARIMLTTSLRWRRFWPCARR